MVQKFFCKISIRPENAILISPKLEHVLIWALSCASVLTQSTSKVPAKFMQIRSLFSLSCMVETHKENKNLFSILEIVRHIRALLQKLVHAPSNAAEKPKSQKCSHHVNLRTVSPIHSVKRKFFLTCLILHLTNNSPEFAHPVSFLPPSRPSQFVVST